MTARRNVASEPAVVHFKNRRAWTVWLAGNHETSGGIWLRIARVTSAPTSVTYPEALETALCYGWIDARRMSLDETSWLQRFTPRGTKSRWSKVNREKVQSLIASGRMLGAGLRAVEKAKADGRWDAAYDSPAQAVFPPDLALALRGRPQASAFFATLNSQNRYAILHRLQTAIKPETRARRLQKFVAMLQKGEKLYP